jgi:hypothetical protein
MGAGLHARISLVAGEGQAGACHPLRCASVRERHSPRHGRAHPGHDKEEARRSTSSDHRDEPGDDVESDGACEPMDNVLTLFLTAATSSAISLPIPARRGARSRGVARVGRRAGLPAGPAAGGAGGPWQPCAGPSPPKNPACEAPSGSSFPPSPIEPGCPLRHPRSPSGSQRKLRAFRCWLFDITHSKARARVASTHPLRHGRPRT